MGKNITSKTIIFSVLFLIVLFIYCISSLYLDFKVNDFFTKVFSKIERKTSSDNIVLISIDDLSIDKIQWPWSRDLFSDIFDFVEYEGKAKSIVFQNLVIFPDTYNPEKDFIFYKRISKNNKVINSYILANSSVGGDILPPEYMSIFEKKNSVAIVDKRKVKTGEAYKAVVNLPKGFIQNVNNLASSVMTEDNDEILRNYMPVVILKDKVYPSLALSAFSMASGIKNFVLTDDYLCSADNCKSFKMPVFQKRSKDYFGNTIEGVYVKLNWYLPKENFYTHKKYSAIQILDSYNAIKNGEKPLINPSEFKDKIVIIGLNADKNTWDQLSETPILKRLADIDVHATMIDNMCNSDFFVLGNKYTTLLITCLFALFIILGFSQFKLNLIFASLLSFLYFVFYLVQYFSNIYIQPFTPILTFYLVVIMKKIFAIATTDKTVDMIKKAMGKYVSKDVMKKVLADLDKLKLGGVRTVVTILFVDIRNFTQISENLPPQDVTAILNEYFSVVQPIIGKYNGIINKYMADGVLAIFGEPIKDDNHALNAIKCGIEIQNKVKILREKLLKENKPKIDIGIGINSGEVFAGNIGTEERLEYTVIGDNVNLAYRIESYNQLLKTQFLISQYTYEYVKNDVEVVKLSQVEIKGKSKPIDIYEVLKIKNE